jgi:hypothetical protein
VLRSEVLAQVRAHNLAALAVLCQTPARGRSEASCAQPAISCPEKTARTTTAHTHTHTHTQNNPEQSPSCTHPSPPTHTRTRRDGQPELRIPGRRGEVRLADLAPAGCLGGELHGGVCLPHKDDKGNPSLTLSCVGGFLSLSLSLISRLAAPPSVRRLSPCSAREKAKQRRPRGIKGLSSPSPPHRRKGAQKMEFILFHTASRGLLKNLAPKEQV